jgi:hypothetical protein
MAMKPISLIVSLLLFLMAILHLLRMMFLVRVIIGGWSVPMWTSLIACFVSLVLSALLFNEGRKTSQ